MHARSLAPLVLALTPLAHPQDRDAGWRSDLAYFVAEARRSHASPARPAHSPGFEARVQALHDEIPELSDDEVLVRLMELAAFLGDGHTSFFGPSPDTPVELDRRSIPFKTYRFPSGLWVVDAADGYAPYVGSRILSFGEVGAEQVFERMAAFRGVDNAMTWKWLGPQFFLQRVALLRAVGVSIAEDGRVPLTIVAPDGTEQELVVESGDHDFVRKLRAPRGVDEVPLWQSDVDTNLWLRELPDRGAVYVQFNQVRSEPVDIGAFSETLRRTLLETGADTLIVDVRHNNGGNNTLLRPLIRSLIEYEMRSPSHRIYVLTGRNTFSAAQNFINRVEQWTDALFVGEPSASSPNFVGETNEFVLPYSRLRGSISNRFWQDSLPWDERPWIEPDLKVELTAEEYFAGVDPVLERVLAEL